MFPNIKIGPISFPTFALCVAVGIAFMFVIILIKLRTSTDMARECYYVIPKLFIALGFAYLGAVFFDALFKIGQNGKFKLEGMTFYGGLVTGAAVFIALLKIFHKNTQYSLIEWLNMVTVPFVVFHTFGRIGCFMGGCCYGKVTDSIFGLHFPDQPKYGIYHHGQKVLPTQLFEAFGLAILALVLFFIKNHRFLIYSYAYPVLRFCIEFMRGDNRGSFIPGLSPAQFISLLLVVAVSVFIVVKIVLDKKRQKNESIG